MTETKKKRKKRGRPRKYNDKRHKQARKAAKRWYDKYRRLKDDWEKVKM